MFKVFIEYKVKENEMEAYNTLLPLVKEIHAEKWKVKSYQVYKGTDQPEIFVEEFFIEDLGVLEDIKKERTSGKEKVWLELSSCIIGGKAKKNIWGFNKIDI